MYLYANSAKSVVIIKQLGYEKKMSVKIGKPDDKELKALFGDQCSPCILSCEECDGDIKLSKKWKCPTFHSGFMLITQDREK